MVLLSIFNLDTDYYYVDENLLIKLTLYINFIYGFEFVLVST